MIMTKSPVDEQGAGPPSLLARRSSTEAIASLFDDTKFNQEHATKKEVLTSIGRLCGWSTHLLSACGASCRSGC